jgi:histidine triad (HIT) family protein
VEDCVFCAIVGRRAPARVLYETPEVICFFPLEPEIPGHTLIASRGHYHDVMDAPTTVGSAVFEAAQALASRYRTALGATGFNLLHASGEAAGQSVPHLHFHFMPRYEGDGISLWPQLPGTDVDLDALLRRVAEVETGPAPGEPPDR